MRGILTTTAIVNKVNRQGILDNRDKQFQQMCKTAIHHSKGQELVEQNLVNRNRDNIKLIKEILITLVKLVILNRQDKEMLNNI